MGRIGLALSTALFAIGFLLLFGVMPLATIMQAFDDDIDIDAEKMLALLPASVALMFIGGVGMSTFALEG